MNIKKIFKNREALNNAMRLFAFIPDEPYLRLMYRLRMGKELNLKAPQTFNEKLQWLKLHDRRPEYIAMVDKYEAKEYAAPIIGREHIISTLGVWDKFDDIDFEKLPEKFVLKCTHDSGGLVICRNKETFDKSAAKTKIEKSLKCNFYYVGREWPYKGVKPRIIAEEYMEDAHSTSLRDYKFYCFNGIPQFLYLSEGLEHHSTAHMSFVNLDWTFSEYRRNDYQPFDKLPPKPVHLDEMIELSRQFSKDIPFLRVDFYEINEKLYFGELTFFPGSGFTPFASENDDVKLGEMLHL